MHLSPKAKPGSDLPAPAMKLLVVEDDAETAAYLVNGLQEQGHLVDHAGRAATACSWPSTTPMTS